MNWHRQHEQLGTRMMELTMVSCKTSRFRLDIRKKFFTVRVVGHWNRLSSEVVDAPCLEALKARLHRTVNSLV